MGGILRSMEIENRVSEEFPGLVDDGNLAASAKAGVDAKDGDGASGRSEQEVVEIVAEDLDGVGIRALLQFQANLALNGRTEETFPGIVDGEFEMWCPITGRAKDAGAEKRCRTNRIKFDEKVENGLGLAAADGQHTMRRDILHRLAVVVVHLELFLLVNGVRGFLAHDDSLFKHDAAQGLAKICVFADGLGDDVACAFKSVFRSRNFFLGVDEGCCKES